MFIHPRSSLENPTRFQTEMGSVYPFSDQNGGKTLPDGAAHSFMAYIREYPPPHPLAETQEIFWECMLPNPPRTLRLWRLFRKSVSVYPRSASEVAIIWFSQEPLWLLV